MALPNLFSRRQRAKQPIADIYQYDEIPSNVKVQVIQIASEAIDTYYKSGRYGPDPAGYQLWDTVRDVMRRELGVFVLHKGFHQDSRSEVMSFILSSSDITRIIDAVELLFRTINNMVRTTKKYGTDGNNVADMAIEELNARLREAGIGYEFNAAADEIIRIDNTVVHEEIVKPAIQMLADPGFSGANKEFLEALGHYRDGDFESAITECGKAFESVLKTISEAKKWGTPDNATANVLVKAAFDNQFIPPLMQSQFGGLRSLLESGTQTLRNASGGHGSGSKPRVVPRHLAAYQLHQTASVIQFLVEQYRSEP